MRHALYLFFNVYLNKFLYVTHTYTYEYKIFTREKQICDICRKLLQWQTDQRINKYALIIVKKISLLSVTIFALEFKLWRSYIFNSWSVVKTRKILPKIYPQFYILSLLSYPPRIPLKIIKKTIARHEISSFCWKKKISRISQTIT